MIDWKIFKAFADEKISEALIAALAFERVETELLQCAYEDKCTQCIDIFGHGHFFQQI